MDERLDPYSGRFYPRESRTEVLARVVRNERLVEDIVRERSWRIVGEKCEGFGGTSGRDWRKVLDEWRGRKAPAEKAKESNLKLDRGKAAE